MSEILNFATNVKDLFIEKLELNNKKTAEIVRKQANYLMVSLQGLSVASKMFDQEQLDDFIENSFKNL